MGSFNDSYSGNVYDILNPLERKTNFPLDRSTLFSSYEDAVKYVTYDGTNAEKEPDSRNLWGSSYIGQIISVHENGNVNVYVVKEADGENADNPKKELYLLFSSDYIISCGRF